ncbi:MAG TPA: hypothetical protein PLF13_06945 [candidate division Zixibacteria bacterium]|nr:hypothetical protein [candidate division Zixibacteria bacterium]
MSEKVIVDDRPLPFKLAGWWGYTVASVLLIYGSVKIILSFLDHDYGTMSTSIMFLVLGLVLLAPAVAFKDHRPWGYYGLIAVNILIILLAIIGYQHYENFIMLALSVGALAALFSSQTKNYLFNRR